jgi:hypothetical protein
MAECEKLVSEIEAIDGEISLLKSRRRKLYAAFRSELKGTDIAKERHGLKGSSNSRAKIGSVKALRIYHDPRPIADVAKAYGISYSHVRKIKLGERWAHITGANGGHH